MNRLSALLLVGLLCIGGCGDDAGQGSGQVTLQPPTVDADRMLPVDDEIRQLRPPPNPERNAYFGDLHVHTVLFLGCLRLRHHRYSL